MSACVRFATLLRRTNALAQMGQRRRFAARTLPLPLRVGTWPVRFFFLIHPRSPGSQASRLASRCPPLLTSRDRLRRNIRMKDPPDVQVYQYFAAALVARWSIRACRFHHAAADRLGHEA